MKKRFVATLDQVKITRLNDHTVSIEYNDPEFPGTNLTLDEDPETLTDQEILDMHNEILISIQRSNDSFVLTEIPPGKPQIEFENNVEHWTARGQVLRCTVDDSDGWGEPPVINIDDQRLSWEEFGKLMLTFAGWGMRIEVVPVDRLTVRPEIEIRDVDE